MPGAALLVTLNEAFREVVPSAFNEIGFAGLRVHCVPPKAEASQVALICPLYPYVDVSVRLAVAEAAGAAESVCVPEIV